MKHSATRDKLGLDSYKEFGFIPVEKESESVSKTLEYAYDDWTIAQMAKDHRRTFIQTLVLLVQKPDARCSTIAIPYH